MKLCLGLTLLMLASFGQAQDTTVLKFSGTVINTTNAENPTAAPVEITVGKGGV